jgi:hypothetical protein
MRIRYQTCSTQENIKFQTLRKIKRKQQNWSQPRKNKKNLKSQEPVNDKLHGLNSPIKRYSLIVLKKKKDPTACCLQETNLTGKDTQYVKRWKIIHQESANRKKAGITVLIYSKGNFKPKRNKTCLYVLIRVKIHQEDIMNFKINTPNITASNYIKQILLK